MPTGWRRGILKSIFKNKCYIQNCTNCRGMDRATKQRLQWESK